MAWRGAWPRWRVARPGAGLDTIRQQIRALDQRVDALAKRLPSERIDLPPI